MIGILDWELTTLGSPLADLGNFLLPFSIQPVTDPSVASGKSTLLVGLNGVSSEESGLPQREEIEKWWVEGMNEGIDWQRQRSETGAGAGSGVTQKWQWPVANMG